MKPMPIVASLLALALTGCEDIEVIDSADVVVTPCPTELGTCALVADGVSRIPVKVEVAVPSPHASLSATLVLSSGTFVTPTDPAQPNKTSLAMATGSVAYATMVAPRQAGFVRIDATVSGVTVPKSFALASADVADVQIAPTPDRLGDSMPIALQVTARAPLGKLSNDTVVTVTLKDKTPATAYAQVFPTSGVLDENGQIGVMLQKDDTLTSIMVEVSATPVAISNVPAGMMKIGSVTLTAPAEPKTP